MGDGKTVTCHSPGTAYTSRDNPASPSPTCGYTYTRSSAGQPHAAVPRIGARAAPQGIRHELAVDTDTT